MLALLHLNEICCKNKKDKCRKIQYLNLINHVRDHHLISIFIEYASNDIIEKFGGCIEISRLLAKIFHYEIKNFSKWLELVEENR